MKVRSCVHVWFMHLWVLHTWCMHAWFMHLWALPKWFMHVQCMHMWCMHVWFIHLWVLCVVYACVLLHTPGYSDLYLSLAESLDLWPGNRAVLQTTYAICLQSMTPSNLPVPLSTLCQRS